MLTDFAGRTAVITGAGSGFGLEVARIAMQRRMNLVLVDVQPDALERTRAEAEAAARREQPAVVLLDLGLPPDAEGVAEGFATLETLRKLFPTMPVVVSSGQDHRDNMLRAIALGAYDFCEKPADLALLRTVLDRALRLRELEEENLRLAAQPRPSPIRDILTADEGMLKVCRTVERLASVS
ncbi:MAG: SDR family NAD(P)-dependent oxidoreductase, partial [Elioraea tepidiphila]